MTAQAHIDQLERRGSPGRASTSDDSLEPPASASTYTATQTVSWKDLPRKVQLVIIVLARLSEPLAQNSLQAYMFYQLKWFDPSLPDSVIATQAGVLHASFTAAQLFTALIWGRLADSSMVGRKPVLLIGLVGTSLSCLGFGFATSFWQALLFRTIGGVTNGNVGVIRTMVSETIREKKYQPRAFLLLPMAANIGIIIGPILGGVLSDPAASYPSIAGDIAFLKAFPYVLPNIFSSIFLFIAAILTWLGLEETLDARRDRPDAGLRLGSWLVTMWNKTHRAHREHSTGYSLLSTADVELSGMSGDDEAPSYPAKRFTRTLPFRRIFTRNVILTFLSQFLLTVHIGTFNSLWFVFLSTPTSSREINLPIHFTGGLGLQSRYVGLAMSIVGVIGIGMQLLLYPVISARIGVKKLWHMALVCFPMAYILVPYLSVVPSTVAPPGPKSGVIVWVVLCMIILIQVTGRTFAFPGQIILTNNCSPHPSVLGTVHGLAQTISSAARTIGPVIGGTIYGFGLNNGTIGLVFWILSGIAICNCFVSFFISDSDGHEIWLDGDQIEE